jgi:hypothetical protein
VAFPVIVSPDLELVAEFVGTSDPAGALGASVMKMAPMAKNIVNNDNRGLIESLIPNPQSDCAHR